MEFRTKNFELTEVIDADGRLFFAEICVLEPDRIMLSLPLIKSDDKK